MSQKRRQEIASKKRRRWQRPAIVSREKLEVIAAVCTGGKGPFEPGDCLLFTNS
ncbi:MAG: hypothetical protein OEM62_12675 [Acidobacteriota bacterium]|nr:hypothetical protein [Acidobacteriota bacterium]